ncbi:hypothetical protein BATDEDRAFT_85462 [Batrachochytrium dendrobatidis JAM81]|uniref:AD domain-containing protein n=2 Tax=Batrachochytrium dendrobatidis TaxID=109871 RepID=F4NUY9_BATDJ|nr:uncharacterized protein BATDEDRAFT_85462 [Batrachochytrium dendrobatidis JAM81]EGF84055.1 hypothetical protein BATDEDRAFT_85462 [Batrachochytrium dendrobatidis JAM81]KAJ8325625.1 protein with role in RNA processing [Batrachochytrium dendrobatidis]KAK5671396.1 protein with role in RNA processing [Batrachochytrium dendrobatidis]OAJ36506.1 hypothetical protein BDEG_20671 [Batrachochytrium dendrobatidis JEL423]|eukprot:XP_006676321.1 hypothetical protein BATDEDRAFT_85462 [Batrachochytrium dendrobatidis JAM81]
MENTFTEAIVAAIPAAGSNPSAAIGVWVQVVTVLDKILQGQVFAYDPESGLLVLQSIATFAAGQHPRSLQQPSLASSNTSGLSKHESTADSSLKSTSEPNSPDNLSDNPVTHVDLHYLKLSAIKSITADPSDIKAPNPIPPLMPLIPISLEQVQQREEQAVRAAIEQNARIGIDVSTEAQDIFDALSKTLPVIWKDKLIVVMDEVTIAPPYTAVMCRLLPSKGAPGTLERVKKVLQGERTRLGLPIKP